MSRRAVMSVLVLGLGVSCPRAMPNPDGGVDAGRPEFDAGIDAGERDAGPSDSGSGTDAGPVDGGCVATITVIPTPYESNAIAISDDGEVVLLNLAIGQGWQAALYRTEVVELAPGRYAELEAADMDEYGVVGRVFHSPEINPAQPFFFSFDGGPLQLINDAGGEALGSNGGHIVGQQYNGVSFWMTPDGSVRRSQNVTASNIMRLTTVSFPRAGGHRPIPQQRGLVVDDALQPQFEVNEFPSGVRKIGKTWAVGGAGGRPVRWDLSGGVLSLPFGPFRASAAVCADEAASVIGGIAVPSNPIDLDDTHAVIWADGGLLWTSVHTSELRVVWIVDSSLNGRVFAAQCRLNNRRKGCKLTLSCL